jgi:hypothetical protein
MGHTEPDALRFEKHPLGVVVALDRLGLWTDHGRLQWLRQQRRPFDGPHRRHHRRHSRRNTCGIDVVIVIVGYGHRHYDRWLQHLRRVRATRRHLQSDQLQL